MDEQCLERHKHKLVQIRLMQSVQCRNLSVNQRSYNSELFSVRMFLCEQRRTHLIVSGALGLGDELSIADVTIALCEQASIHDARRLHLHLRLHKNTPPKTYADMNMIKCRTE